MADIYTRYKKHKITAEVVIIVVLPRIACAATRN